MTVLDIINAYAIDRGRHVRQLSDFAQHFGQEPVTACSQRMLLQWVQGHETWTSPHTKTDAAGLVVSCFTWAARQGLIGHCPFVRPRGAWAPVAPRVAITPAEYQSVMLTAKRRGHRKARLAFRLGLFFLWETGARTGEMRALGWQHIDFATGIVTLLEHKTLHSTGQARLIVLSPVLWRLLRGIHRRRGFPVGGFVFLNSRGRPWQVNTFGQLFKAVARAAGIRVTISPYCLRHGFCVRGLENGVGERQIADLMGHTTTRYISWYGRATRAHGNYLRGVLGQFT